MNLFQFLEQTDQNTARLSRQELADFIHNMARLLPEEDRDFFLSQLKASGKNQTGEKSRGTQQRANQRAQENAQQAKALLKELKKIADGILCLDSAFNEEYNDWYDSPDEEFVFSDPHNICRILKNGAELVQQCLETEGYREGYELAEALFSLPITVKGDYEDYNDESLTLADMKNQGLLDFNIKKLLAEGLAAAWHVLPVEERPEVFFQMICDSDCWSFTLEDVFQCSGRELDGQKEFLSHWIRYLGTETDARAKGLMKEALALNDNPDQALETARRFVKTQPELYENLVRDLMGRGRIQDSFKTGQEALKVLSRDKVRAGTALLTARAALLMDQTEEAEKCWLEAFLSDPIPVHYLRLAVETRDFSGYKRQAGFCGRESASIRFLKGDFERFLKQDMYMKKPLGWSFTFMKTGIGLLLLYLYGDGDREQLPPGCRGMLHKVVSDLCFTSREYKEGLLTAADGIIKTDSAAAFTAGEDESLFWSCFCRWRQLTPMADDLQKQILKEIEGWLRLRTDGIMEANRRNYYDECAAFIAALGEVLESREEPGAKQRLMKSFRDAWSRRSSFRQALKNYGYRE